MNLTVNENELVYDDKCIKPANSVNTRYLSQSSNCRKAKC